MVVELVRSPRLTTVSQAPPHLVIGGGVIGLCSAYFLSRAGHRVVVIDRDPDRRESCSDRNAGMVVPSHFIPLAAPGVISQGLKWMLNRKSPFYLRPRLDIALWKWCWEFASHSNREHVANSQELLRDLSLESRRLFDRLSEELGFTLVRNGLLVLCQSEAGMHEEKEVAGAARRLGIEAEICGPERLRELDPDAAMSAIGGIWFPNDAHLDSEEFLAALRQGILRQGGEFLDGEVEDFEISGGACRAVVLANGEKLAADRVTIACGAWSPAMTRRLGLRLLMQGGKGYSFTIPNPTELPRLCSLLKEGRVAVTPMGGKLRVAGTMEICGDDLSIDMPRLQGIIRSFCRFFPAFTPGDFEGLEPWSGLRPCSPDGLPYIGPAPGISNVIIASGHSMLGLSLGPVTGRMVAALAAGTSADRRLDPARFA